MNRRSREILDVVAFIVMSMLLSKYSGDLGEHAMSMVWGILAAMRVIQLVLLLISNEKIAAD